MAVKPVVLRFTANVTSLRQGVMQAGQVVRAFDVEAEKAGRTVGTMSKAMLGAATAVGGSLVAGFAHGIKSAVDFQREMANVATVSQAARDDMAGVSDQVLDLSRTLPQSASILAQGLYDVASSGFDGAEGMAVLTASATAASAGMTDTATSARAITAVLNAYGRGADDAADVSDVLFQTVNVGVVSFAELAQNLGDIVGISAAAGVGLEEVGAALAAITLGGVPAAEAATSLSQLIAKLIDPSATLAGLFAEWGYQSGQAALQTVGLQGVMERIGTATGGNVAALQALFPEVRAVRGAFGLLAQDGATFARVSADIAESSGATQAALEQQAKSLSFQWGRLRNNMTATATEVGQKILPVFSQLVDTVMDAARAVGPTLGAALSTAGRVLADVGGLVRSHAGWVMALAAAYGASLVPALVASARAFVAMAIAKVTSTIDLAVTSVKVLALEMGTLNLVMAGMAAGVAVVALGAMIQGMMNAKRQADELIATLTQDLDLKSLEGTRVALANITFELENQMEEWHRYDGIGGILRGALELATPFANKVLDNAEAVHALTAEQERLAAVTTQIDENLWTVANTIGWTNDQVEMLARSAGVDLTGGWMETTTALYGAYNALHDTSVNTGRLDKAVGLLGGKVSTAEDRLKGFKDALDVLVNSQLGAEGAVSNLESAFDRLNEELVANGRTVDLATEAGRDNAAAIRDTIDAAQDHAAAMAEQGDSYETIRQKMLEYERRLRDQLTQAGLTREEIDRYVGVLHSIPAFVATQIRLEGADQALATLNGLSGQLLEINSQLGGPLGAVQEKGVAEEVAAINARIAARAAGGITRTPQIRTSAILWAEAGPEAYIPLGPQHHRSAVAMTAEVARILGVNDVTPMGNGGLWPTPSAATGGGMHTERAVAALEKAVGALQSEGRRPVQMQNVFNENVDPIHVARRISWQLT